ncbi:peptide deformylase [Leptothermofonsia sichuanensis E412]|uniref:peptide deformylase n=1 Tax=Leptothermofonsia sichuanensis TaxID=2917832 RepID=UPI001CA6A9A2|nr:peptide deformylase [Leptothermofonsia sichuanensis]QZZ19021.1 peptide deformylase [Leptothermofonsia sichuanensis E412]
MAEILSVIELGNSILRQRSRPVGDLHHRRIQTLVDNLMATLSNTNGVGIAAPQVAQSERLFIVASRPNPRYPNAPEMEPTVMINPRILAHSEQVVKGWEGCLSVPGIRGLVPRYQAIEVEYIGRDGSQHRQELTDFVARIFQHELDHLNGIVFLDRVESTLDLISEKEFQAQMAQTNS